MRQTSVEDSLVVSHSTADGKTAPTLTPTAEASVVSKSWEGKNLHQDEPDSSTASAHSLLFGIEQKYPLA